MKPAAPTKNLPAVQLPEPVARRGITEAQWRTLANNLYPGASSESVIMVWDYCQARKLDPLKKPCHIVSMRVKDQKTNQWSYRDVVMPGIYELRTTAMRTGMYMGQGKPVYGEHVETYGGVLAPEWCEIEVERWNPKAKRSVSYFGRAEFDEVCVTKTVKRKRMEGDKEIEEEHEVLNDRWARAPKQMLTKCAEADALRRAFPDELGGVHAEEEMHGRVIDVPAQLQPLATEPQQRQGTDAEAPLATDDQVLAIKENLAKSGVPDNLVLAKFEVGDFDKIRSNQVPEILKFIEDNAP